MIGIIVGGLSWFWTGRSFAQEQEVAAAGRKVYEKNCAVCHGREGKGDGGAATILTVKPANLTQISKKNKGEFPFWKVYRTIDGREEVKSHGTRTCQFGADFRWRLAPVLAESQVRTHPRIGITFSRSAK
jgi:hypothetical protein